MVGGVDTEPGEYPYTALIGSIKDEKVVINIRQQEVCDIACSGPVEMWRDSHQPLVRPHCRPLSRCRLQGNNEVSQEDHAKIITKLDKCFLLITSGISG